VSNKRSNKIKSLGYRLSLITLYTYNAFLRGHDYIGEYQASNQQKKDPSDNTNTLLVPARLGLNALKSVVTSAAKTRECLLKKLGGTATVFTEVSLEDHHMEDVAKFERNIAKIDEVIGCHLISGGYDYLLKFVTWALAITKV
jgi:DNA-binding Lrp family transcriptional regulator